MIMEFLRVSDVKRQKRIQQGAFGVNLPSFSKKILQFDFKRGSPERYKSLFERVGSSLESYPPGYAPDLNCNLCRF
jgi:hypothetical protein